MHFCILVWAYLREFVKGRASLNNLSRRILLVEFVLEEVPWHAIKLPFSTASILFLKTLCDWKSLKVVQGSIRENYTQATTQIFFFNMFTSINKQDSGRNMKWHPTSKRCQPGRPLTLEWDCSKCLVPHFMLPVQQGAWPEALQKKQKYCELCHLDALK